jgi:hypothetical protein
MDLPMDNANRTCGRKAGAATRQGDAGENHMKTV